MGLFDFFKRKKKKDSFESQMAGLMGKMFPGGQKGIEMQVAELKDILPPQYSKEDIRGTLCYMTCLLYTAQDRSSHRIVQNGAMRRPDNVFSYEDGMTIYTYAARKQIELMVPGFKDMDRETRMQMFEGAFAAMGNNPNGCTTDEIPEGYGEYGLCETNPVPVRGTSANEIYLKSLKHESGRPIKWHRIGSTGAPNIKHPIDMYEVTNYNGEQLAIIFISPYQNTISKKAPKGFTC